MDEMKHLLNTELTERELVAIGTIVALWGSLEYEIFRQTLMSFDGVPQNQLPKQMNNLQFSKILKLWESRVVDKTVGNRQEVLRAQLTSIRHNEEYRNALVHGMWNWSAN